MTTTPTAEPKLRNVFRDLTGDLIPAAVVGQRLRQLGIGRAALRGLTQAGKFPRAIRFSERTAVYRRDEVLAALDRLEQDR